MLKMHSEKRRGSPKSYNNTDKLREGRDIPPIFHENILGITSATQQRGISKSCWSENILGITSATNREDIKKLLEHMKGRP